MNTPRGLLALALLTAQFIAPAPLAAQESSDPIHLFVRVVIDDRDGRAVALEKITEQWQDDFTPMLLETLTLSRDPVTVVKMLRLLEQMTGEDFRFEINRWFEWLWTREPNLHARYPEFKALLYGLIDPAFMGYFGSGRTAKIRLDEVRWGGVAQDGIPPLRSPNMVSVSQASYLEDDNVVFGLEVNGDARAYPKRILAWHEMFVDDVGGVPVAGVYCTLCGTMILYETTHNGVNHALGTSGFLYRSNKLMYDKATQTLWNTIWGTPVIGPLADQDIRLERMSVVTTTWGEWRRRHPETTVLSLDTGYERDYSEGAAYHDYFATDDLMFSVPVLDERLKNKDEVVGLVFSRYPDQPLAVSATYLNEHPVYHDRVGDLDFVILTDDSGANRVYEAQDVKMASWDGDRTTVDEQGKSWHLTEDNLESEGGRVLHRLPAHRAFWFGWFSAYTHTRLVM